MKDQELMTCADWQEMLASMHEDDHSFAEWVALNEHVESCPACAAVRAEYRAMRAFIRQMPAPEPPPEFPPQLLRIWDEQNKAPHSIAADQSKEVSKPAPSTSLVPYTTRGRHLQREEEEEEIAVGNRRLRPKGTSSLIRVLTAIPLGLGAIASIVVILSTLGLMPNLYHLFYYGGMSLDLPAITIGLFSLVTFTITSVILVIKVKDMAHSYKMKQGHRELELEEARQRFAQRQRPGSKHPRLRHR